MKQKPPCPVCTKYDGTTTLGGGTHGKYRYECIECDAKWSQIPLSKLNDINEDPEITISTMKNDRRSSAYKCGRCGISKKGHSCTMKHENIRDEIPSHHVLTPFCPPAPGLGLLLEGIEIDVPFANLPSLMSVNPPLVHASHK